MSILWRLNAMIAGLVLTLLASFTLTMLIQAAPRIQHENESMTRLAREFFLKSFESLSHAPDPAQKLEELVAQLQGVRHIEIKLVRPATPDGLLPDKERGGPATDDAAAPKVPDEGGFRLPVVIQGRNLGLVVITPQPSDEIEEIWEAALGVAQTGFLISAVAFLIAGSATRRMLTPFGTLERALNRMQEGDYDVDVAVNGPPEISGICRQSNTLAAALRRARDENRQLSLKLIEAQDSERREIARELHDELGPVLFAVRATGTSLRTESEKPAADQQKMGRLATTMLEQIETLQVTNKRVLRRIAPVGLDELGLQGALEGLIALWRKQHPAVEFKLDAEAAGLCDLDRTLALTVYRMVQEAITNAIRHGQPSRIDVSVTITRDERTAGANELAVRIVDDGRGLAADAKPGFGLSSMRERIAALGGTLTVNGGAGQGVTLCMVLRTDRPEMPAGDLAATVHL